MRLYEIISPHEINQWVDKGYEFVCAFQEGYNVSHSHGGHLSGNISPQAGGPSYNVDISLPYTNATFPAFNSKFLMRLSKAAEVLYRERTQNEKV